MSILKGFKHSEITKKRISEKLKGRKISIGFKGKHFTEEMKLKSSLSHKGKKHSLISILKMSESHKKMTDETKKKMSESHIGKHASEITKLRMSQAKKKMSDETKRKIGQAAKGRTKSFELRKKLSEIRIKLFSDPNNIFNWKGGISKVPGYRSFKYRERRTKAIGFYTFKQWEWIINKYGHKCICCGLQEPEIKIVADHVIPLSKGGSNFIENIQPLCMKCNSIKNAKIIDYREFGIVK